ncbi:CHAT domain-containing protein [Phormidium tenue FACHB-886]|nr:CHAT domain-containing protein [Phormidium tenue FACHB-886]
MKKPTYAFIKALRFSLLSAVTAVACLLLAASPAPPIATSAVTPTVAPTVAQVSIEQSQLLYESGRYVDAAQLLQQAIQAYAAQGDKLRQALALSNLSLTYQQLGQWAEANQAISDSLALLPRAQSTDSLRALAQVLNIQGQLQLAQGQSEQALATWEQTTATYEQLDDLPGILQSQINQAQALQALGLYRRAISTLSEITQTLQTQPDSLTQAIALRTLGDALLVSGNLPPARDALQNSLNVATRLQQPEAIAAAQLSLGNLTRAEAVNSLTLSNLSIAEAVALLNAPPEPPRSAAAILIQRRKAEAAQAFLQQTEQAIALYQQAATRSTPKTHLQAQLNQLNLWVETQRWTEAQALYPLIEAELEVLPVDRTSIYNRINLAQSLVKLDAQSPALQMAAQLLALAGQQAKDLGDSRAQSYALGNLGSLYEKTQQWQQARSLTQQALMLSQATNASDIAYRWQWQMGRLLKIDDREAAINAYAEAVATLQTLRNDLVAVNRDVQFSFRESVEPVYREFVALLLQSGSVSEITAERLTQAQDVIEGLQIAELDNFFREACLDTTFGLNQVIDRANLAAAVFYTIVLPDRLEVILKVPQQPLRYHSIAVSQAEVEATVDTLLTELKKPFVSEPLQTNAQQLYSWLIRPQLAALQENNVETLVFVLDGALRSIPVAALYDGQQYLIENYSVAIAPGLQLPDPKPLEQRQLKALVAGLSEARESFPPLNFVQTEVERIQADVPSQVLLNQNFTEEKFQELVDASDFSIVHIATHGQFSSNATDTFILTWDNRINVNELASLLQARDIRSPEPIELLVLSACQTAVGDRRATLGLAGIAVRAGARSTIASLWSLDDEAGAALMSEFYQALRQTPISKAEALRRAQRKLIADAQAPRFWSPYVLLGNWL